MTKLRRQNNELSENIRKLGLDNEKKENHHRDLKSNLELRDRHFNEAEAKIVHQNK